MKRLAFITLFILATLLQADTFTIEKKIRVISSEPLYANSSRHDSSCCDGPSVHYRQNPQYGIRYEDGRYAKEEPRHLKRHHRHQKPKITGYRNIGYFQGRQIVKQSRRPLRRIPLHIRVSY